MSKKIIRLAKNSRRLAASLVDFLLLAIASILCFVYGVYPHIFDKEKYVNNNNLIVEKYEASGLYCKTSNNALYNPFTIDNYTTLADLTLKETTYNGDKFSVNVTKNLYDFYVNKFVNFEGSNITLDVFCTDILKVGTTTSNISALSLEGDVFSYKLLDPSKLNTTLNFMISTYSNTCTLVSKTKYISNLDNENRALISSTFIYLIPIVAGFSFILNFLIPLLSSNGESIGKYMFGLCVLNKDGYHLKWYFYIPRYIVYCFVEVILGVCSFGGTFLISYTMFLFTKKKRCLHDYCSNSVVIDKKNSNWFETPETEREYLNSHKDEE